MDRSGGLQSRAMGGEILSGLRVLDFTRVLSGPYATRMLADFGAEVIKVQSARTAASEANTSPYFTTWNRNKLSITLNMDHPGAREIVLRLTAMSDIVVENFSPRVLPNWNLGYEQLKEAKSDIILASISAAGQTGPWRDYTGFGPTFHALSGLTCLSSPERDNPCGPGHAYADTVIALYMTLGILAALEYRDRTGEGQHIDLSGYEAACTLLGPALSAVSANAPERQSQAEDSPRENGSTDEGDEGPVESYEGCYRCSGDDRWCVLSITGEREWRAFCKAIGKRDWLREERFSTARQRQRNRPELDRLIGGWTARLSAEEAVQILQGAGVMAGVVQSAADLARDPHLRARDFFITLEHPVLGATVSERPPFRFSEQNRTAWEPAPLLGADNDYVFCRLLGLSEDEVRSRMAEGLIR